MIKFFRQIRQRLLMENKTSKYFKYAIGEIVLVVIGILIALQINSWNQDRLNRIEEKTILTNLKGDFENAITEFELLNALRDRIIKAAELITQVNPKTLNKYKKTYLDSILALTLASPTFNNNAGSLNVLLSSGKINLITDAALKKDLIEWPGDVEDMIEDEVIQHNLYNGPFQEILSEYVSWNDLVKKYTSFDRVRFEGVTLEPMPDNPVSKSNYKALFSEIKFLNILHRRAVFCQGTNIETKVLIAKAKKITNAIDKQLK